MVERQKSAEIRHFQAAKSETASLKEAVGNDQNEMTPTPHFAFSGGARLLSH
jgi:hypothetical protein